MMAFLFMLRRLDWFRLIAAVRPWRVIDRSLRKQSPERVRSFLQDPKVRYAAG